MLALQLTLRVPLTQVAKTKQQIEEQRVQVQVVERAQQVAVQEQEIARREKELEARVRKPAEAERYKLERLAEAERSGPFLPLEGSPPPLTTGAPIEFRVLEPSAPGTPIRASPSTSLPAQVPADHAGRG